jgi:hypothetical protein
MRSYLIARGLDVVINSKICRDVRSRLVRGRAGKQVGSYRQSARTLRVQIRRRVDAKAVSSSRNYLTNREQCIRIRGAVE